MYSRAISNLPSIMSGSELYLPVRFHDRCILCFASEKRGRTATGRARRHASELRSWAPWHGKHMTVCPSDIRVQATMRNGRLFLFCAIAAVAVSCRLGRPAQASGDRARQSRKSLCKEVIGCESSFGFNIKTQLRRILRSE